MSGLSSSASPPLRLESPRPPSHAGRSDFIRGFLCGGVDGGTYARLLAGYELIYTALETSLDRLAEHPTLRPLRLPGLARRAALATDLAYFTQACRPRPVSAPAAAHRYADRIRHLADHRPTLLVAHVHTRYLGDLAGGPVLGQMLRRSFALPAHTGTAFCEYPGLSDPDRLQQAVRARLAALPLDEESRGELGSEMARAFHLTVALFDELEGRSWTALSHLLAQSLRATLPPATAG